jgi:hypothetical protein
LLLDKAIGTEVDTWTRRDEIEKETGKGDFMYAEKQRRYRGDMVVKVDKAAG